MSPKVLETTVAVQSIESGSAWSSAKMSTLPEEQHKYDAVMHVTGACIIQAV